MLVEDEPSLVAMYRLAFEKSPFDFQIAENAEDAFEKAQENMPDIILLDIFIPASSHESIDFTKREGFEVLDALRANSQLRNTPVLVLTNLDSPQDKIRAQDLHVVDYILKTNILPKEVVTRVSEILSKV